mmetsp:Transcript_28708/g.70713  ORF Transcript_28708/g.70713 Transcript_28708/m.70713 type:complete len:221 (-) Transcript_28708:480-1142(-)
MKISLRPRMSGRSTRICLSKRPGRISASSRMSARLVAARITMPLVVLKPSISTSSWLSVFSRSSLEPANPPPPRLRPTASISSMKMMHGASARACAKRSRTRLGPTPTNISMKSEPEMLRKGTDASPAVALASSVLPVPGGPTSNTPRGQRAPAFAYFCGLRRQSTTSSTCPLACGMPAISSKEMPGALDSVTELSFPPAAPPPNWSLAMRQRTAEMTPR